MVRGTRLRCEPVVGLPRSGVTHITFPVLCNKSINDTVSDYNHGSTCFELVNSRYYDQRQSAFSSILQINFSQKRKINENAKYSVRWKRKLSNHKSSSFAAPKMKLKTNFGRRLIGNDFKLLNCVYSTSKIQLFDRTLLAGFSEFVLYLLIQYYWKKYMGGTNDDSFLQQDQKNLTDEIQK